jgi:serine/threonine protein kinase
MEARGQAADPWIGRTIDRRFLIEERIKPDAFSTVYRAEHLRLGGKVALKLLPTSAAPEAVERLEREARTVTLIGHDNIIKVLDFGRLHDVAYLAMEYLEGETLLQRVEREGRLKLDELCTILIQVALALSAAHARDVIHRGIHPGNIFLCSERGRANVPKILDFGLSSLWPMKPHNEAALEPLSAELAKRPAYIAPEMLTAPAAVDHRVDLFALGITFYHALAGTPPFTADQIDNVPERSLVKKIAPLSHVVPDLPMAPDVDELVDFALQKEPTNRIGSAEIFRRALVDLRKGMNAPTRRREEQPSAPEKRTLASWVSNGSDFTIVELAGALDSRAALVNVSERIAHTRVSLRLARVDHIDSDGYYKWSRWLGQLRTHCTALTLHDCSPKLVQHANLDSFFFQGADVTSVLAPFYCHHCNAERLVSVSRDQAQKGGNLTSTCHACGLSMPFDEVQETYFRLWSSAEERGGPEPPSGLDDVTTL